MSGQLGSGTRLSCTNCCVVGCHNTYTNTEKSVKFYSFPSRPHEKERRLRWINAVKRKKSENSKDAWEPKRHSRICSEHFVGKVKSNHPQSPAYIPTIFPQVYSNNNKSGGNVEEKEKRFSRVLNRQKAMQDNELHLDKTPEKETAEVVSHIASVQTSKSVRNFSSQVNFGDKTPSFIFYCEYHSNNEISTSCNLPTVSDFKIFVEKAVGPDSEENLHQAGFHGITSIKNDEQLVSLSSVHFVVFNLIFSLIESNSHGNNRVDNENRLLLFLMKMKLGVSYIALGALFGINRSTAQRIFTSVLEELVQKMKNFVFWPSREVVSKCMPKAFQLNYPNCRVIIDCSEIKIQQPNSVDNRIYTYSHYKSSFTAKFLIGIAPNGFVSFISNCYGGRASDAFITNDSGILTLLEPGDIVLADKGFPGIHCEEGIILVMPPFLHNGRLTLEEVENCYNVASVRIHVERALQRVKLHGILNNFTNDLLPYIDNIVFMCCVLSNLQCPIIKQ